MSKNRIVDGKEYLPSAELAQRFGYTPDYLSRLAREGKVVATNINRKWFVNEDSLTAFTDVAKVEKEVRSAELKNERKVERLIHEHHLRQKETKISDRPNIAFTQALVVLMCVVFMGALGWIIADNNITTNQLVLSLKETSVRFTTAVIPSKDSFHGITRWSLAALHGSVVVTNNENSPTTNYIADDSLVTSGKISLVNTRTEDTQPVIFSDEVVILFEEDSKGVVRPVFKYSQDGQDYRVLIDPINDGS